MMQWVCAASARASLISPTTQTGPRSMRSFHAGLRETGPEAARRPVAEVRDRHFTRENECRDAREQAEALKHILALAHAQIEIRDGRRQQRLRARPRLRDGGARRGLQTRGGAALRAATRRAPAPEAPREFQTIAQPIRVVPYVRGLAAPDDSVALDAECDLSDLRSG